MKLGISTKRLQIDKANATIVGVIAGSAFVIVFCLVATKALMGQAAYQNRVITEKEKAVKTLRSNLQSTATLVDSFKTFNASPSLLGNQDTNAKIVLDALPSKYDFPALATSLEKILTTGGYKIDGITGTDDEAAQANSSAPTPEPVEIPFAVAATTNYAGTQKLILDFERSIRPINIMRLDLSGTDATMRVQIEARTYYQPEKTLTITEKVVK